MADKKTFNSQLKRNLDRKVRDDTMGRLDRWQNIRRSKTPAGAEKTKSEVSIKKGGRKHTKHADSFENIFESTKRQGMLIALLLGLTVGLLNDIFDLVWWQNYPLISYTLDISSMILLIMVFTFLSNFSFINVLIIFSLFIIELMPVIGILPSWTLGILTIYAVSRMMEGKKEK